MHFDGWNFWGMHFLWWLFWIAVVGALVGLLLPASRNRSRRETPLELLQRRYAAGEISSEDYEERKAKLERDNSAIT